MRSLGIIETMYSFRRVFIALIWVSLVVFVSQVQAEEAEALKKYQDILRRIERNKQIMKPAIEKKKKAEINLGAIQRELKFTALQLDQTRTQLTVTKTKEKKVSGAIEKIAKDFEESQDQFKKRLSEVYKNKNVGTIEYIFSGQDIGNYAESAVYFNRIMKKDADLIDRIKNQKRQLKSEKEKLVKHHQKIAELEVDIKKKEETLEDKKKSQAVYISALQSQIAELERQNGELEEASNQIAKLIQQSGRGSTVSYIDGGFIKPVSGWVSSRYGYRIHPIFKRRIKHNGIDFVAPKGERIYAANAGRVIVAGEHPQYRGYGNIVVLDHGRQANGNLVSTFYAHQSRVLVTEGQFVKKGELIGWVGSTGYSTGPHLHFEVRINGQPVDPASYLRL